MHLERVASLATRDRQHGRHWRRRPYIPVRSRGTDSDLTLGWGDQYRVLDTETQPPATVLNGPVFGPIGRPGSPDGRFLARVHALEAVFAGCCRNRVALGCSPLFHVLQCRPYPQDVTDDPGSGGWRDREAVEHRGHRGTARGLRNAIRRRTCCRRRTRKVARHKVYRTGPHLWRIDYGTPDGIETVDIQATTEAEAEQQIREQLRSRFSN